MNTPSTTTVWKAWINLQPPTSTKGGKLIVTGEENAGPEKIKYELAKASPQGTNPQDLLLEVVPPLTEGKDNLVQLRYEEDLQSQSQYTTVTIRIRSNENRHIKKIDIVH